MQSMKNLLALSMFLIRLNNVECQTWGYKGNKGPDQWPLLEEKYCYGRRQSPIRLDLETSIYDSSFPSYTFSETDLKSAVDCDLYNNGKSINVDCVSATYNIGASNSPKMCLRPRGLHFHWGSNDNLGSEHWLNGRQFAMESHLVTWDCQFYNDFNTALNSFDGLSVFGVFYEVVKNATRDPILQTIIDNFSKSHIVQCNACLNNMSAYKSEKMKAFDFSKLFPTNKKDIWSYYGSLTTPDCRENVRWNVFNTPIQIPPEQIQQFRLIKFPDENGISDYMVNNFRTIQPLNPKNPPGAQRLLTRSFSGNNKIIFNISLLCATYVFASMFVYR